MRKRRRVILMVVATILIVSIIGIIFVYNHIKAGDTYSGKVITFSSVTYSDIGITNSTAGYLTFTDIVTGKRVFLCDKPNCKHDDLACNAYQEGFVEAPAIYNDKLFFIMREDIHTYNIYEADTNSSNRKIIGSLDNFQYILNSIYIDNYIIIAYTTKVIYDDSSEGSEERLEKPIVGVAIFDLNTHEITYIPEKSDYSASIFRLHVYKNKLYYEYIYTDEKFDYMEQDFNDDDELTEYLDNVTEHKHVRIYCYDISTGSESYIYSHDIKDRNVADFSEQYAFILDTREENERVYALDLIDLEEKFLVENSKLACYADDNRLVYYSSDSDFMDSSSVYRYYYYDLDEDKSFYIGEGDQTSAIKRVVADYFYTSFYDEDGEFSYGSIHKEDFYGGNFDKVTKMHIYD